MISRLLILSAITTLLSAGAPSLCAQTGTPRPSAEEAIALANTRINLLLKEGKYEEAGAYFAEDVKQIIAGQPPIMSRTAWVETQKGAGQIGEWDLQLETLELEICNDIAVERGRGVQSFTANDNSPMPSFTMTGDYVVMWKLIDGEWKIQWDYVVIAPQGSD